MYCIMYLHMYMYNIILCTCYLAVCCAYPYTGPGSYRTNNLIGIPFFCSIEKLVLKLLK